MKKLFPLWFIVFVLLYFANRFLIDTTGIPFIDYYLNDLLAVPVVMNLVRIVMCAIYRTYTFTIRAWMVAFVVVYMSTYFELVLPQKSAIYTADWLDVIFYTLGGISYFFLAGIPLRNKGMVPFRKNAEGAAFQQ